jgi:hypothetical protein
MKIKITLLFLIFNAIPCISQVATTAQTKIVGINRKEWSKEIALYQAKHFLFSEIIGTTTEITRMEMIPLAAASSGELTTILYKSEQKNKEGMILGFYTGYENNFGLNRKEYEFKNFEKDKAIEFLNKIDQAIIDNKPYLKDDNDNNNIFFKYDDIEILITREDGQTKIRLFWKDFDSSWEGTAFGRSKRRFERKIK